MIEERLYSTGNDDLDYILEKAFCEGYEYAQKLFFMDPITGTFFTGEDIKKNESYKKGNVYEAYENTRRAKALDSIEDNFYRRHRRVRNKLEHLGVPDSVMGKEGLDLLPGRYDEVNSKLPEIRRKIERTIEKAKNKRQDEQLKKPISTLISKSIDKKLKKEGYTKQQRNRILSGKSEVTKKVDKNLGLLGRLGKDITVNGGVGNTIKKTLKII